MIGSNIVRVYDDPCVVVTSDGDVTTATLIDQRGLIVRGHAKLHPDDDFSDVIGEDIATARALARYYRKMERRAIRSAG